MKACFIGLGYIGLPTAIIDAKSGIEVIGVDTNPTIVKETNAGHLHIVEPNLEDLLKFGLIPEFIGRLPVVAKLDQLDKKALVEILTKPKNALVKQYQALLKLDGVELEVEEDALDAIAELAQKRNTGARGLRSIIEEAATDVMFGVPSDSSIKKCIITRKCIEEGEQPKIIRE